MGIPTWKPTGELDSDGCVRKRQRVETSFQDFSNNLRYSVVRSSTVRSDQNATTPLENRSSLASGNIDEASTDPLLPPVILGETSTEFLLPPVVLGASSAPRQQLTDNEAQRRAILNGRRTSSLRRSNAMSFRNIRLNNTTLRSVEIAEPERPVQSGLREENNSSDTGINPELRNAGRNLASMLLSSFVNRELGSDIPFIPLSIFSTADGDNSLISAITVPETSNTRAEPNESSSQESPANNTEQATDGPVASNDSESQSEQKPTPAVEPFIRESTFYVSPSIETVPGERLNINRRNNPVQEQSKTSITEGEAKSSISRLNQIIIQHSPFSINFALNDSEDSTQHSRLPYRSNTIQTSLLYDVLLETPVPSLDFPTDLPLGDLDLTGFEASHWTQLHTALEALETGANVVANICTLLHRFTEELRNDDSDHTENVNERRQYIQVALRASTSNTSVSIWARVVFEVISQLWTERRRSFFPERLRTRTEIAFAEAHMRLSDNPPSSNENNTESTNGVARHRVTAIIQRIHNIGIRETERANRAMSILESIADFSQRVQFRRPLEYRQHPVFDGNVSLRFILAMRRRAAALLSKCENRSSEFRALLRQL